MSDLVIMEFPSEQAAEDVRTRLLARQKDYLVELGDAVVAVRAPDGAIRLNQLVNPTPVGAVYGGMWGFLVGLLFLFPLAGAAVGTAAGAIAGRLSDVGINDAFMKEAARSLQSGKAALFLLVNKMTTEKIVADFQGSGGKILQTSFDPGKEHVLRQALEKARAEGPLAGASRPPEDAVDEEDSLDAGLEDSFPASDPVSVTSTTKAGSPVPDPNRH